MHRPGTGVKRHLMSMPDILAGANHDQNRPILIRTPAGVELTRGQALPGKAPDKHTAPDPASACEKDAQDRIHWKIDS